MPSSSSKSSPSSSPDSSSRSSSSSSSSSDSSSSQSSSSSSGPRISAISAMSSSRSVSSSRTSIMTSRSSRLSSAFAAAGINAKQVSTSTAINRLKGFMAILRQYLPDIPSSRESGNIDSQPERPVAVLVFEAGQQFTAGRRQCNERQRQQVPAFLQARLPGYFALSGKACQLDTVGQGDRQRRRVQGFGRGEDEPHGVLLLHRDDHAGYGRLRVRQLGCRHQHRGDHPDREPCRDRRTEAGQHPAVALPPRAFVDRADDRPVIEACFGFRHRVVLQQFEEFPLLHHAFFVHDIYPACVYNTLKVRNWFHPRRGFDVIGPAPGAGVT